MATKAKAKIKYALSLNKSDIRVYNETCKFNSVIDKIIKDEFNKIHEYASEFVDCLYREYKDKRLKMGITYNDSNDINSGSPSKNAIRKELYKKKSKIFREKKIYKMFHDINNWKDFILTIEKFKNYKKNQKITENEYFNTFKTASVHLKYNTNKKDTILEETYINYLSEIKKRISHFSIGLYPSDPRTSSKNIDTIYLESARWKQLCFTQASNIFYNLTQNDKHYSKKIDTILQSLNNIDIILDERFFNIKEETKNGKIFNFIDIMTPIRKKGYKNRYEHIRIPYKPNKYLKKLMKEYKLKKCIKIYKNKKGQFYIKFLFYKNETNFYNIKNINVFKKDKTLGISPNYENFMSISDENNNAKNIIDIYDYKLKRLYNKFKDKKRNSKSFNNIKIEIENTYRELINKLKIEKYTNVIIEDYKSKIYYNELTDYKDKLKFRRWNEKFINILKEKCKENGVFLKLTLPVNNIAKHYCHKCKELITLKKESTFQKHHVCEKCGAKFTLKTKSGVLVDYKVINEFIAKNIGQIDVSEFSPVGIQSTPSDSEISGLISSKRNFNHVTLIKYLDFIHSKGKIVANRCINKLIRENYLKKDDICFYKSIVGKAISARSKKKTEKL